MGVIQRPTKEGNATTYQGKVAAGYTGILAAEVDADLDTIYAAWNGGTDTVNIADGSVTTAKLAAAPNGVATGNLNDGAVTLAKLAAEVKAAGGDLSGQYPNPAVAKIASGTLQLVPRGLLQTAQATVVDLYANNANGTNPDPTKPSWLMRLDYTGDQFQIMRAPAGSNTYASLFAVTNAGKISGGAAVGARVHVNPTALTINTYNTPVIAYTLPALTTKGGAVVLTFMHSLYYSSSATSGNVMVALAIYRDGAAIVTDGHNYGSGGAQVVLPIPAIVFVDTPPAGTHTYDLRVQIASGTSASVIATQYGDLVAQELG
jgi:hypothetical protein